jgi:hypothetical protein
VTTSAGKIKKSRCQKAVLNKAFSMKITTADVRPLLADPLTSNRNMVLA